MAGTRKGQLTFALADQALSSGSNVVFLLILARVSDTSTFGQATIAYSFFVLVVGLSRACVTDPLLIASSSEVAAPAEHFGGILTAALTIGAAGGLVVVGVAPLFATPLIPVLMGVCLPALAAQDAYRALSFRERRMGRVFAQDAIWAAVQAVLTVVFAVTGSLSPGEAMAAWGAGALVSAVVSAALTRCSPGRGGLRWMRLRRHRSLSMAIEFVSGQGSLQLSLLTVAAVLGPAGIGALRIALLAVSPLNLLAQGLYGWAMPRLAGHSPRRRSTLTTQLVLALGSVAVLVSVCVALAPRGLMIAVMGDPWAAVSGAVLAAILLERSVAVLGLPLSWLVRAQGGTYHLALNRTVSGVALLLGSTGLAALYGVTGAAVGFLLAALVSTTWCLLLARAGVPDQPLPAAGSRDTAD